MRIYLIRHGEKAKRTIEKEDPSLTQEGERQIKLLARRLKLDKVITNRIYASSHIRSVETAEILSKELLIPVIRDDRLVELERELFYDLNSEINTEKVIAVKKFVDELVSKKQDVILAMHGQINRAIISYLTGISLKETRFFAIEFGSLSVLELTDVHGETMWRLKKLNDTTHLTVP